jgi:transposase
MLHKSRDLMVRQRTILINVLRGQLAEYGIVTGRGRRRRSGFPEGVCMKSRTGFPHTRVRPCIVSPLS